jgi:hypothetical protein
MRQVAAAALLCAVFLAGCATRQQEPLAVPAGTKTIGAAIGIGDTITFDDLAHFGTGSVYDEADVKQWKLDEVVYDAIRQAAGSRYAIVPAKIDVARLGSGRTYYTNYSEAFAKGFAKTPAIYAELFSSQDTTDSGYPFDAIESDEPADLYLLVTPERLGGHVTGVHGLGIGRRPAVMGVVHRNFWLRGGAGGQSAAQGPGQRSGERRALS